MYAHVLVPVSFDTERDSAGALAVARLLAGDGGHISLLHVIEQVPAYAASYLPAGYQNEARKTIETRLACWPPICPMPAPTWSRGIRRAPSSTGPKATRPIAS